jgi:hypothetical protein
MTTKRAINPDVLKLAAFLLARGLRTLRQPSEEACEGVRLRDLKERAAPFLFEDEIERANARCFEVIAGTLAVLPELSADLVEGFDKDGVEGVKSALRSLTSELREELARALMRIVDDDEPEAHD